VKLLYKPVELLLGAVMAGTKAVVDRAGAVGFVKATGTGPASGNYLRAV
jgi:hypothetical protein